MFIIVLKTGEVNMEQRNILEIIQQVINEIPDENNGFLKRQLEIIMKGAAYHAPEQWRGDWSLASKLLNTHLPYPPVTDWQKNVFKIWTTKEYSPEEETTFMMGL